MIGGSPTSLADVEACVRGADVVIHCLGVGGKGDGKPTTLISDSVKAALTAMQKHGVPRIVCMSNVGTGGSGLWLVNRVLVPPFPLANAHRRRQRKHGERCGRTRRRMDRGCVSFARIVEGPRSARRKTARRAAITASLSEVPAGSRDGPQFLPADAVDQVTGQDTSDIRDSRAHHYLRLSNTHFGPETPDDVGGVSQAA